MHIADLVPQKPRQPWQLALLYDYNISPDHSCMVQNDQHKPDKLQVVLLHEIKW